MSYSVTICNCPTTEQAREIAQHLVEKKLAACVNLLPQIESVYQWQQKICNDSEVMLVIKSKQSLHSKIQQAIQSIHAYDVPEVIHLKIEDGLPEYLNWIATETR